MMSKRKSIEIDLSDIFHAILKHLWIVFLCGAVGALVGGLVSYFLIPKVYESSTKIYVMSRQDENVVTYNDVETGRQLTKDYVELITARPVLEEVMKELGITGSTEALKNKIEVGVPTDTRVLKIVVTDTDPNQARKICDAVRVAATKHIHKVIDTQKVRVVETANLPEWPKGPKVELYAMGGAGVGILLALSMVIIFFVLNVTIKDAEDVEYYLDTAVIGMIPERKKKGRRYE